jgi:hypothetical protein
MIAASSITRVASTARSTSGVPNSRATIAACEKGPPTSVTAAAAMAGRGVQIGDVACATSTSPGWNRPNASGPATTRAMPFATPGLAGEPVDDEDRIVRVCGMRLPRSHRHAHERSAWSLDPAASSPDA